MIVAATGHRPNKLGGYSLSVARRLETLAFEWLSFVSPDRVISGLALGWDQAIARAAFRLDIPVTGAVPFSGQESKWPEASQHEYVEILGQCNQVEVISLGGYTASAMQRRNEWMVQRADLIVALWDGSMGGTGNCMAFAKHIHVPSVNLWTLWRA